MLANRDCYIFFVLSGLAKVWTKRPNDRYRAGTFFATHIYLDACGCFAGGSGGLGAVGSGEPSARTFLMNPGGTTAVRMARSPDCSTLRLPKKAFTSASVPWAPTLPSAA